jgi:predicted nucleotidyltransferase
MIFGLSDHEYELLAQLAISPLQKCGAKVWIFGSRARGDQRLYSDIDLLYKSEF